VNPLSIRWPAPLALALALAAPATHPAPYKPQSDQQVLVRLPSASGDPRDRQLAALRKQLSREPRRVDLALAVADANLTRLMAEGDPRYAGHAQAAIAPWWTDPGPPPEVRVRRAVLRQFQHDFDGALSDLEAVVGKDPDNAQAWAWIAAISMVQAHYDRAHEACEQAAPNLSDLHGRACLATVAAATGQARRAAVEFEQALAAAPDASPELRLWTLTRLAETLERVEDPAAAERVYRAALALGLEDSYLLAAYADFLLDRGRPAEVITLLKDRERNDLHLLRLALAGKAVHHPQQAAWQAALAARFDAARQRGDTAHQKEEARFALELLGDAPRALALARANYQVQREAADARVLLQAALAARQKAAAAPVLAWLRTSHFESPPLQALAAQLEALP
jgi:Tfp pilus assembly protein PilF